MSVVMTLVRQVKRGLLSSERRVRRIPFGLLRGLSIEVDLASQFKDFLGVQERELHPWFRHVAPKIRSAVDVGAADGWYTLYFLARTPAQRVIAFDPEPRETFRRNLAANGLGADPRLEFHPQYVGISNNEKWRSLDTLIPSLTFPSLIKIDVDGGERNVLQGAQQLLQQDAYWMVETHSAELEEECLRLLKAAGLSVRVVDHAWWRRGALAEQRTDFRGQPLEHNRWIVAARDPASPE